ncbi:hypothetical protein GWI33_008460 [Rhynchophorus ferrugineus]|uniref:Uncharacterized protein n=1 Tax=Rhynchophorus ferrugineus TaxID=354439 RepID=A0A834MB33_RHYFE|nr:hypothetical protein GWI33_008460 [Rhynchophorus ferrugineus]
MMYIIYIPQPQALHYYINKDPSYSQLEVDDNQHEDNKKSVANIFQLSVTTLAFLAFGGYLLYLVAVAIKSKNISPHDHNTEVISAFINAQLNKKKKKKRPIQVHGNIGSFNYKQSRSAKMFNDITAEKLYYVLLDICSGYNKYFENGYKNI